MAATKWDELTEDEQLLIAEAVSLFHEHEKAIALEQAEDGRSETL